MSWLRIDDGFTQHHKVLPIGDKSFRLHVATLCYCARNLTDGLVSKSAVRVVLGEAGARARHIDELVNAGLWQKAIPDGYRVCDYLDWNPSKEEVVEKRARNAERQAKYRDNQRDTNTERNALRDVPTNDAPSPAQPSPVTELQNQYDDVGFGLELAVQRLLSVLTDKDDQTGDTVRRVVRRGRLAVGDIEAARESAMRDGARSPSAVAVAELRKRANQRTEAA